MGEYYRCRDCKYGWKSKKNYGTPSICPRCKSQNLYYDTLKSSEKAIGVGIFGLFAFIIDLTTEEVAIKYLGFFGLFLFIIAILMILEGNNKNRKLRRK